MEQMLAHLTSASAQAAAASLVSGATAAQYMSAQLCRAHPLVWVSDSAHPALCSLQPTSEEDLCPICYAHPISAVFQPCGHKSCKYVGPRAQGVGSGLYRPLARPPVAEPALTST